MSRTLLNAANRRRTPDSVSVEAVLTDLGDRSFAWAMLFFALLNLIPAPPGSTLLTAVPHLIITSQMALGYHHVRLPAFVTRRRVPRDGLRAIVIRLRPLIRPIERVIRPRWPGMFTRRNERIIGAMLFAVAAALFIPLPGSGAIPAFALLVSSLGLLERDWLVTAAGLVIGAISIVVTIAVLTAIEHQIEAFF
jgi:hypothetical protein